MWQYYYQIYVRATSFTVKELGTIAVSVKTYTCAWELHKSMLAGEMWRGVLVTLSGTAWPRATETNRLKDQRTIRLAGWQNKHLHLRLQRY